MTAPRQERPEARDAELAGRIERAKRELERMIDLNPQGMMLVDRDGVVMRINRSLMGLLGHQDFGAVLGKRSEDLFVCEEAGLIARLLAEERGYVVREGTVRVPPGASREMRFSVIGGSTGETLRVVIVSDLSEERRRAKAAEDTHKREAVQALAGALMHNFNQTLTVMTVRAKLMLMAIEKGRTEIDEIAKTLSDIMDLALGMAETLKRIQRSDDYATEPYPGGLQILDIRGQESGDRRQGGGKR